jgi:hypothetical protein
MCTVKQGVIEQFEVFDQILVPALNLLQTQDKLAMKVVGGSV